MANILVADDEINILEVITDVLENAGHDVTPVGDGEAALAQLKKNQFDVALLDVMMPRLDGYHLSAMIHGLPRRPKIIIISARDFDADRSAIVAAGVDAFLSKPFSNKELLEAVTKLLDSPAPF